MKKRNQKKALIAITFVIIGVSLLIYRGISDTGVYYMTVAELLEKADSLKKDENVRISGDVVDGSIDYNQRDLILTFTVRDADNHKKVINAIYNGVVPDAFKPDVEVVIEGVYDKEKNLFQAVTLLAKCPSKYSAEIEEQKE